MAIYEMKAEQIERVPGTTFGSEGVKERADLQRLLRGQVEVVAPGTLILAEEFGQWEESKRRIDLLALDRTANLVVIELKRTEVDGHMELQAIRYAAMVSTMTFEHAVRARAEFQARHNIEGGAEDAILEFLGWDEPDEDQFAQEVRIVLVSADFSKELTTAVMWLNTRDLDIRCVRLKPYSLEGRLLLDVQQVIPLPEAADYQVQVKQKTQKEKIAKKGGPDFTRYDVAFGGQVLHGQWKRRAILFVVRSLLEGGVSPERIAELIPWHAQRMWLSVEGEVDGTTFVERASKEAQASGGLFDARRWFCDDDDLLTFNGRTLAFTSQWGKRWPEAMKILAEAFPEHRITFEPMAGRD